jgi:transcription termination/antitermination protein NusA
MLDIKELSKAVRQVAEEKGLQPEMIMEAIESSIAAAYKRDFGQRGEVIKCKLDEKTGELQFWQVKTVVDETMVRFVDPEEEAAERAAEEEEKKARRVAGRHEREREEAAARPQVDENSGEVKLPRFNPERHITLDEAHKIKKDAALNDELEFKLEAHDDFGRIAAQTAKQVILQKLRESERDSILSEWRGKEGQIVSGAVQRFERGNVFIDLGRTIGVMFTNESIPGEHYRAGERLRFLVLAVQEDTRLPGIILSRSHPKFVAELFKMEVPELAEGAVEIKSIAREPGNRTKIAVASTSEGVDPVGALVGQRGTRVMAVNNELGNEKIDIIEWSDDADKLIANALSPAKVEKVDIFERREARAFVPESQLSLAIGRGGQNVRLAAKLTGWKIDVRSQANPDEAQEGGVAGTVVGDGSDSGSSADAITDIGGEADGTGQIPAQTDGNEKEDVAF